MRTKPDYIAVRIAQLKEDRTKASKDYDKVWYSRLIQELAWAPQMATTPTRNCYMEEHKEDG